MFNTLQWTSISSALTPIFLALVYAFAVFLVSPWIVLLLLPRHTGFFAFLQIFIYVPILGSLHILSHLLECLFTNQPCGSLLYFLKFLLKCPFSERFLLTNMCKKASPCFLPMSLYLELWAEYVPLKFICGSPNLFPLWWYLRWGLWGVIRSWGWAPHEWDSVFIRRDVRKMISFPTCGDTARRQLFIHKSERGLSPDIDLVASWSWLYSPRTVRTECLLLKPFGICYSSPN